MFFGYWLDKYILIFLGKMPINIDHSITKKAIETFLISQTIFVTLRFIVVLLLSSEDEYVSECLFDTGIMCKSTLYSEIVLLFLSVFSTLGWLFLIDRYFNFKIKIDEIFDDKPREQKSINYFYNPPINDTLTSLNLPLINEYQ